MDAFERRSRPLSHFRGKLWRSEYYDDNYRNLLRDGYSVRVTINGREIPDWVRADPDAGTVEAYSGTGVLHGLVAIRLERSAL